MIYVGWRASDFHIEYWIENIDIRAHMPDVELFELDRMMLALTGNLDAPLP